MGKLLKRVWLSLFVILFSVGMAHAGDTTISGTFTGDPYSARFTDIVCNPNVTPVIISGSVDVTLEKNGATMIGLVDKLLIDDAGASGYGSSWWGGAYLYLGRSSDGTNLRIGPSDGFLGGELNAVGANVAYTGSNTVDFTMVISAGSITVTYDSTDYTDTYGEIKTFNNDSPYPWDEFSGMAYVGAGWWPPENSVDYDLTISGCEVAVAYPNLGQCVSNRIKDNCSELTGGDRKDCVHEQIGWCQEIFEVGSNHVDGE